MKIIRPILAKGESLVPKSIQEAPEIEVQATQVEDEDTNRYRRICYEAMIDSRLEDEVKINTDKRRAPYFKL